MQQRAPQFLILEDPAYRSFWEALAVFWETDPPAQSIGLYCRRAWPKNHLPVPGLLSSVVLHFSVALFLLRVPLSFLVQHLPDESQAGNEHHVQQVVYVLRPLHLSAYFPTVKPGGPGGKPGQGNRPERPPVRGGAAMNPKLSIISNPPHPDNNRQTILQPASPPDLKMTSEVRLPNVLFGDMAHPRPEIAPPPPAPVASRSQEVLPAPTTGSAPPASTLALAAPPVPVPNPALPLPLPTSRSAPSDPRDARDADRITDLGVPTRNTSSLLSLSVDPAPAVESITLPPGNRRGAFSISPGGDAMGSPGGIAGGDPQGGWGGSGAGGDPSTGIGAGSAGGGGGARALASEGISISVGARAEGGDGGGVLPSFFAATLVYPVRPTHPRRVAMVVTAGPAGGGGLRLYGVLKGGKVYTIYLPMPGRNWILQYCAEDSAARKRVPPPKGIVVRLDPGLVPPSAEEQFDFHRPPWSHQKAGELIILHGVIREDGSVNDLSVVQGLPGAVDQAALAAFARWRFKPALRDGKPVAVEVLVGIPALSSET